MAKNTREREVGKRREVKKGRGGEERKEGEGGGWGGGVREVIGLGELLGF